MIDAPSSTSNVASASGVSGAGTVVSEGRRICWARSLLTTMANKDIVDGAVGGGGISGLHTAWRILTRDPSDGDSHPRKSVVVLQLSKRTGRRLLTWRPFPNQPDLHGKLGGTLRANARYRGRVLSRKAPRFVMTGQNHLCDLLICWA